MLRVKDFFALLRINHWVKNTFIFAALLFSEKLYNGQSLRDSILAFIAFCLVSSSVYILNDLHDAHKDRHHPKKKNRPIAAGRIGRPPAIAIALLCFFVGTLLGFYIQLSFFAILLSYVFLNLFYTYIGKGLVIIDSFCIALGFVLRVAGGALSISVQPSGWIMMTTFFLALFLGFGKRRNEILIMQTHPSLKQKEKGHYNITYVNHILIACGTISLLSYALYTRDPLVIQRIGTNALIYTVPIVAYGLFRYTYLIWDQTDGDPTDLILHDLYMLIDIFLWLLCIIFLIYLKNGWTR